MIVYFDVRWQDTKPKAEDIMLTVKREKEGEVREGVEEEPSKGPSTTGSSGYQRLISIIMKKEVSAETRHRTQIIIY